MIREELSDEFFISVYETTIFGSAITECRYRNAKKIKI